MSQALTDARGDVREIVFLGMPVRAHDTGNGPVCELSAAAGPIAPPHRHPWPETHYVLEGAIDYMVAGATHTVSAGQFLTIPGNTVHALSAGVPARWLEITSPVGPADFFEEVAAEPGLDPSTLEGMQRISAIAAPYQVELLLG